jgi:hypothetical protein
MVALFCPRRHAEVERDVQELARKVAQLGFTDMVETEVNDGTAASKEAVVVCIDCSNSMNNSAGFTENVQDEDEGVRRSRQRHLLGFDDRPPEPDTPEALRAALDKFATASSTKVLRQIARSDRLSSVRPTSGSSPRSVARNVLAEWGRMQQRSDVFDENNSIRLATKYCDRFIDLLMEPASSLECQVESGTSGVPQELQCPITCQFLEDPVVAEDGFTYERTAILEWLRTNAVSPMTRAQIGSTLTPNQAIRSMAKDFAQAPVERIPGVSFQVFITGTNQTLCIDVLPSTTVASLTYHIAHRLGAHDPGSSCYLRHNCRRLKPAQTVAEHRCAHACCPLPPK